MKKRDFSTHLLFFLLLLIGLSIPSLTTATSPPTPPPDDKVVYLTFDDGPTPKITEEILDILKAHDVKATFFIVGKEIKGNENLLIRMYQEGHTLGLHTFSHNLKTIYQSPAYFISEMEKTEKLINEVLGTSLHFPIIRFPGGSAARLNTSFYKQLCDKNYLIFDWNVDLQDGIHGNLSPEQFLTNAKKCMTKGNRRIILAHCNANNHNTCQALSSIISYYRDLGYTFKPLTEETPPYFYRFKK